MKDDLKTEVIEAGTSEIKALLTEHIDTIDKSMQSALASKDPESSAKFKYKVSIGLEIEPHGTDQAKVTAKIGYSVRHKDESIGKVVESF